MVRPTSTPSRLRAARASVPLLQPLSGEIQPRASAMLSGPRCAYRALGRSLSAVSQVGTRMLELSSFISSQRGFREPKQEQANKYVQG